MTVQNSKNDVSNPNEKTDPKTPDQEILDRVQALPSKEKKEILASIEMYSGPIPHPKILAGYEKLYKGAAKKIIDNGVEESNSRRYLELKRQKRRGHLAWFSLIFAALLTALFIILSYLLIMNGHNILGGAFGGAGFISLIGVFANSVNTLSGNDDLNSNHDKDDEKKNK